MSNLQTLPTQETTIPKQAETPTSMKKIC